MFAALIDAVIDDFKANPRNKILLKEVADSVRLNNVSSERIADVVHDELKFNAGLEKDLAELGYGAELIDWYEVKLTYV